MSGGGNHCFLGGGRHGKVGKKTTSRCLIPGVGDPLLGGKSESGAEPSRAVGSATLRRSA